MSIHQLPRPSSVPQRLRARTRGVLIDRQCRRWPGRHRRVRNELVLGHYQSHREIRRAVNDPSSSLVRIVIREGAVDS